MHTIAFIGSSGTGKSHHAIVIAQEYNTDMIIDDGLLIQGSRILAGTSAKQAPTKVGAIKTALFTEDDHAAEVKNKIKECQPSSILILGTSLSMTEKIAARLDLPQPGVIIHIEDVVAPESISKAKFIREKYGTHVVPAPTVEVKRRFSGNFFNPIRTLFHKNTSDHLPSASKHMWVEQTQVRPTFSSMGKFYIANNVIIDIIKHITADVTGLDRVVKSSIENSDLGIHLHIYVSLIYGYVLPDVMTRLQQITQEKIDEITSLNVLSVNIHAVKLVLPKINPDLKDSLKSLPSV
ncbi:Asp23/Gls24 family envelope stress response protein [Dehalobacterium formicoaceticum]|uniref:Asp23/Gls24 family envelope stress response protein n=1 Tax=Dehalobacterium formicoaceticum TaxID=51515 RepID=A0ABT1Y634_9FIRM|nr:hypothetical protein [Dehalobacterium formicoaceticum]MCR6546343.1 Asp23/Gls24 family envelope stress response protein [Dehalobacterium formicoaceticum]